MVQSAKKERVPSLAAASTMRAVMAPWGVKPDLYDPIEEDVKAYLRGE